jgi:hypothetical protein
MAAVTTRLVRIRHARAGIVHTGLVKSAALAIMALVLAAIANMKTVNLGIATMGRVQVAIIASMVAQVATVHMRSVRVATAHMERARAVAVTGPVGEVSVATPSATNATLARAEVGV